MFVLVYKKGQTTDLSGVVMNRVLIPPSIDVDLITYLPPKPISSSGRIVQVLYDGGPLLIRTPYMTAPVGASKRRSRVCCPSAEDFYTIELSFEGLEKSPPLRSFYDMLQEINSRVVADAIERSSAWYEWPNVSGELVRSLFRPMIGHLEDERTGAVVEGSAPVFRVSLPFRDGAFQFPTLYHPPHSHDGPIEVIETGCTVSAIVQCTGIYVSGFKCVPVWKMRHMRLLHTAALRKDEDKDKDKDKEKEKDKDTDKDTDKDKDKDTDKDEDEDKDADKDTDKDVCEGGVRRRRGRVSFKGACARLWYRLKGM